MQLIAEEIGITTAQISLAWLLSKRICVIPKSNNILREAVTYCLFKHLMSLKMSIQSLPKKYLVMVTEKNTIEKNVI